MIYGSGQISWGREGLVDGAVGGPQGLVDSLSGPGIGRCGVEDQGEGPQGTDG